MGSSLERMVSDPADEDDEDDEAERRKMDKVPSDQWMQDWLNGTTNNAVSETDSATDSEVAYGNSQDDWPSEVDEHLVLDDFEKYARLVMAHPAYDWLLSKLQNKLAFTEEARKAIDEIRREVLKDFPNTNSLRGSTQVSPFHARFLIDWPLRAFLEEQMISDSWISSLSSIITLSGSINNAQALTCEEYLDQTWPTTGAHLMRVIEQSLDLGQMSSCRRPDGAEITVREQGQSLIITIAGTKGVIAEVAEQLCWLSAALCTSPRSAGPIYCIPRLQSTSKDKYNMATSSVGPIASTISTSEGSPGITIDGYARHTMHGFRVSLEFQDVPEVSIQGTCWRSMLRAPVIAKDFPILLRPRDDLGLEIPLNVMAGLVDTTCINVFYNNIYLKGLSAMLIAMGQIENVVLWHLHCNESGSHIPYREEVSSILNSTHITDLGCFRHVVGWSNEVSHRDMSASRSCKVAPSRCLRVGACAALEGSSLSFNRTIDSGRSFVLLRKDQTIHISRRYYSKKLSYLVRKFVLFWDTKAQRGWLINGVSALLQLVIASLHVDHTGPFHDSFNLDWSKLQEAAAPYTGTASAALQVLKNMANLSLTVTTPEALGDSEPNAHPETFAHRVEEFYHALERLITYQEHSGNQDRRRQNRRSRAELEGWDFVDLTNQHDPARPCATTLPTAGKSWVDFLRSIDCAAIFGGGFGELIRPNATSCCSAWTCLLGGQCYIAIALADLRNIAEIHGDPESTPIRLSNDTIWHSPLTPFKVGQCLSPHVLHTDIVQVTWPLGLADSLPSATQSSMSDLFSQVHSNAAIVFGQNDTFQWHWRDHGDPIPGPAPAPPEKPEPALYCRSKQNDTEIALPPPQNSSEMAQAQAGHSFGNSSNYGGSHRFGDRHDNSYTNNFFVSAEGFARSPTNFTNPWSVHYPTLPLPT